MIKKLMPHICIVLALVTLTLLILSVYNPWILTNDFFAVIMYLFFGVVLFTSGMFAVYNKRPKE